jgi:RimJ/RimL family protein N-acetyltransferase
MGVTLIEAMDRHFAWMLGLRRAPGWLRLPPGGVDDAAVLELLRGVNIRLKAAGCRSSWLIVSGGEVVGLCCFKHPPDGEGCVEFGYGIAESRRRQGSGTAAVAAMVERVKRDSVVHCLVAETTANNIASHRILERNGFSRTGTRIDPEDGVLVVWRRVLRMMRMRQSPPLSAHEL